VGYFNYKKAAVGSYLDRRNPPYKNEALGKVQVHADSSFVTGDQYGGSRFNPVKDRLEEGSVLEDWIPRQPTNLHMMFRKIYLRDAIAGTVVDIFSTLPWGKFYELQGIDDPKVRQMYYDMIEVPNLWGELPMLARELQIIGRSISSLSFNESLGVWDSIVTVDPDQARIQPLPISGAKPLIDVLSSPSWREFARSTDPRVVELKGKMNPSIIQMIQNSSGFIPMEPMNTLWLARRVDQYDHIGTSIFTRILPAWAYETALWNASLIGARRRNRAILLITAGIEESWLPTDEEVASLVNLFMQADEDPVGGVIGVRNGVEVSEVRDPTAIWGISQEFEFLSTLKMRALGVSEAYLSGETNVSNMEAARTSLGKQISAFKENMLSQIFYKQLFPSFARIHGFQRRTQAELSHGLRFNGSQTGWQKAYIPIRAALDIPESALLIPKLITEDTMRPEGDIQYMEILNQIKEQGVPIPLRMWCSVAGYDLDKAMAMMEEDALVRKRIQQLQTGEAAGGEGGGGGDADMFADEGGGGGEESAPPGPPGTGTLDNLPGGADASPSSGGDTLPPRWTATSSSFSEEQIKRGMSKVYSNSMIEALAKLDPRILAEVKIPHSRALVPYSED